MSNPTFAAVDVTTVVTEDGMVVRLDGRARRRGDPGPCATPC